MLTCKLKFQTPGNCYHIRDGRAGLLQCSTVPTVFNITAALFAGTIEPLFKVYLGNKLLIHETEENLKWGLKARLLIYKHIHLKLNLMLIN